MSNVGGRLSELGRREQALAATEEAVTIRRLLAEASPDAYLPDLAASLNNFGRFLSELGRREQALAATEEAVTIRRLLAEASPDAYLPDLAASLTNLGTHLSELGRREQALARPRGRRDLPAAGRPSPNPAAYLPDLAMSLWAVGWVCDSTGIAVQTGLAAVTESLAAARDSGKCRRRGLRFASRIRPRNP